MARLSQRRSIVGSFELAYSYFSELSAVVQLQFHVEGRQVLLKCIENSDLCSVQIELHHRK